MTIEHNQHDEEINKVLRALRDAVPPEGMQARIADHLRWHTAASAAFTSRGIPLNSNHTGAWWRGACTGAATAMLVTGIILFTGHYATNRGRYPQTAPAGPSSPHRPLPQSTPAKLSATMDSSNRPCLHDVSHHLADTSQVPPPTRVDAQIIAQDTRTESTAPSHPAPALPLTPQERELVHLAHTADPRQLAALSRDEEARLEAEKSAEFARYFSHPAAAQPAGAASDAASPSVAADPPEATPDAPPGNSPDAVPDTNPATPPTPQATDPSPNPNPGKEEQK